jgi:serine protease AprX
MKRTLFVLSFLALFTGSVFGQNSKLDKKLNDLLKTGKGTDKVRVIIQRLTPASASDRNDITNNGGKIRREFKLLRAQAVELPLSTVTKLAANPSIKRISIDAKVGAHAGEPYAASGAALANQNYGVTGNGVGVAVIDSGIASHPDLNVAMAVDFTNSNSSLSTTTVTMGGYDPFGHGTHVAGIIAGSGAASGGAHHGMAPNVNLVDLRVLDQNGGGYVSDVMAAIDWAVTNANTPGKSGKNLNIRVINLSLGFLTRESAANDPLSQECLMAVQNGMVVVASAGNYGRDSAGNTLYEWITSPGIEPAVLTVGAMTTWGTDSRADDTVATYSSRGPTYADHALKPDVVAPGSKVISTMSPGSFLPTTYPQLVYDSNYMTLSGTSMAAPVVSGAVALMLEKNPSMQPNAVKAALMYTAESENVSFAPITVGAGYVNVAGAVNLAANINTAAPAGQNWLVNNGLGLDYSEVIGGTPAVWGKTILWNHGQHTTDSLFFNVPVWSQDTIVWDEDTIVWDEDTIVWDETVVVGQDTIVWDETIISGQDTIIWDEDTIVWDETFVWGAKF